MHLKLEAIIMPVWDVDRAKTFSEQALGLRVDLDQSAAVYEEAWGPRYRDAERSRFVQLAPPGSACSIQIGQGLTRATPGSYQGLYLITSDMEATRAELVKGGVQGSEPFHFGPLGQTPGLDPERANYRSFVSVSDPDGNAWLIQEITRMALQ